MAMTVGDLRAKIQITDVLSDEQRQQWFALMPQMTKEQLVDLAQMILWAEEQGQNLEYEGDEIVYRVASLFSAMNQSATRVARKEYYAELEFRDVAQSEAAQEDLLNQLKDA